MILEVTLVPGAGFALPGYLQGRLSFPLHVNVTPVNDPPLLEISTAKVLRLAQVRHRHLSILVTSTAPSVCQTYFSLVTVTYRRTSLTT